MSRHLKDPIGIGNPATAILMWKPFNSAKMEIHVVRYKASRESTEGYSKSIVPEITTSSEKDWFQQAEHYMQVPKGRDQVSRGVSAPCRHARPVANVLWKPLKFGKRRNGRLGTS